VAISTKSSETPPTTNQTETVIIILSYSLKKAVQKTAALKNNVEGFYYG